ncbi:aconitase X catalytic domain-containing protein [Acuticoccus sp. MNP-M23]|uniref:aconitase X catalytic domain-containing protein n=1 Tax=Acuticoccus sp. MNP-M23 TaxID=3072793 RepID=UPI002815B4FC|nr:aconitase X catalytic domain-containing protein [Acuticoccus sp. MNP-M23]WMS41994.1 aconitase X catalytic domain-containing protein [Acuticoccus sp. MNP-M23]
MRLSERDRAMLDGAFGEPARRAMDGLVQLGEAFDASDMVDIGYAHIHAGMAMYGGDVDLITALAAEGATMRTVVSTNIANADMARWQQTGAPPRLAALQQRAEAAHKALGGATCFTCTPYFAGHRPTAGMHAASIESGVTIFANSVLGALANRDGFFAVYAGMTGRYPRFGLHLPENRVPTHHVAISAAVSGTTDFTALGYAIGAEVTDGIPFVTGLGAVPDEDELDAMGVGMATSGGVAMFVLPGVTPGFAGDAAPPASVPQVAIGDGAIEAVYDKFCTAAVDGFDLVHLGCPHASLAEMRVYAGLLAGRRIADGVDCWVTTNRTVRSAAEAEGLLAPIEAAGARVVSDTCPMSCHFARTCSPDPSLGVTPPTLAGVLVDSVKQAHYVRDMIQCPTLVTTSARAVESAVTGRFVPRPFR